MNNVVQLERIKDYSLIPRREALRMIARDLELLSRLSREDVISDNIKNISFYLKAILD